MKTAKSETNQSQGLGASQLHDFPEIRDYMMIVDATPFLQEGIHLPVLYPTRKYRKILEVASALYNRRHEHKRSIQTTLQGILISFKSKDAQITVSTVEQ